MNRAEALRRLEEELGVTIRRVKRVIGERAREVHEELQPASYFLLVHVAEHGPVRASDVRSVFDVDKGAISRQVQHLIDLGLLDRTPDPEDGRATLLSASGEARRRLAVVTAHRRKRLEERLGGWSTAELVDFVTMLGRYNDTLDRSADLAAGGGGASSVSGR